MRSFLHNFFSSRAPSVKRFNWGKPLDQSGQQGTRRCVHDASSRNAETLSPSDQKFALTAAGPPAKVKIAQTERLVRNPNAGSACICWIGVSALTSASPNGNRQRFRRVDLDQPRRGGGLLATGVSQWYIGSLICHKPPNGGDRSDDLATKLQNLSPPFGGSEESLF